MDTKNFVILISIFTVNLCIGQTFNISGYKNGIKTDNLIIGFNPNCSASVDTLFGERDISVKPNNEKGLVVLQKKETDFRCLYNLIASPAQPVYFNESFESKVNIRNGVDYSQLFFEIRNYNKEFDYIEIHSNDNLIDIIDILWTLDSCYLDNVVYSDFNNIPFPLNSLAFTGQPNYETIIIKFRDKYLTNVINTNLEKQIQIFPNPSDSYINIKFDNSILKIKIYDLSGKLEFETKSKEFIDISQLDKGVKVIKIYDKIGIIYLDRFIKI